MLSRLTIRKKIVALIVSMLTISLFSYLFIGTSLFVDDKTSYIYDTNLSQLKTASMQFERTVEQLQDIAKMTILAKGNEESVLTKNSGQLNIFGVLYFKEDVLGRLELQGAYGKNANDLLPHFNSLKWTAQDFRTNPVLVKMVLNGEIALGGTAYDASGQEFRYFLAFALDVKFLDSDVSSEIEIRMYDSTTNKIHSKRGRGIVFDEGEFAKLAGDFYKDTFAVGAKDWLPERGGEFIIGHKSLFSGNTHIFSIVSKNVAFAAAETLVKRSLFLGISIILASLGISLAFSGSMTDRLARLYEATKKVSTGDFSIDPKLEAEENSGDEIDGLVYSFTSMSKKISDLLGQTAQKARMEKELEEAQTVQTLFFPPDEYRHNNVSLYGKCIPATECGGDWWQYMQVENDLYFVIGDVTGHGFSAALLTGAVYAGFGLYFRTVSTLKGPELLEGLVKSLSHVVAKAGAGKSSMSFLAVHMDLSTGMGHLVNAAHRPPYLYRKTGKRNVVPIMGGQCPALGDLKDEHKIDIPTFEFQPGDIVLAYTDGLIECKNTEGNDLSKQNLIKMYEENIDKRFVGAKTLCESIVNDAMKFFGPAASHLEDDITLAIASIPKSAKFVKKAA